MENLSTQQREIFNKYKKGDNIFITGPGGTGKTYLIKKIVEDAKRENREYKVCALTGCAAILLECNAVTLHAFAGIGLANGSINQVVDRVLKNSKKKVNWKKIDLLIVDEVSMLSLKLFIILDLIAKRVKQKRDIPFGGMQIIFSGDFYQLPPVGDEEDIDSTKFCFESPLWNSVFSQENQIVLEKVFRQSDDAFAKILNRLRVGKVTQNGLNSLEKCVGKPIKDGFTPTIIFPRRKDVDQINNREFNKLNSENEKTFKISKVDEIELVLSKSERENISIFTDEEKKQEVDYLSNNIMAEQEIKLRIGTLVMCIANLDIENGIINGSQGKIIDFKGNNPLVKFKDGQERLISPHMWQSEKNPAIAIRQIPLIYAWAITIHKAQGLTLDNAFIDIGDSIFECGQSYVALSRVKSLEGLYLKRLDLSKIKVNKCVKMFYENLEKNTKNTKTPN